MTAETRVGLLSRADGSASYKTASCSVLASVNGPMEVRQRDELLGEATLELHIQPAVGLASTSERDMEALLKAAVRPSLLLGLHPRSLVQVTVQVMVAGDVREALLAACINVIALACIDAGLAMQHIPVGAHVELEAGSRHTVCYTFPGQSLVLLESAGQFRKEEVEEVERLALAAAQETYTVLEAQIRDKVEQDDRWQQ
ncbi:ribosomal protein S5 domain 2-type protein [Protomyces lactucae-debilis]|uniref:Ribosomal protein S5 domain 2-type protein n=1 Tax=Protomyces lactucae-debilis TaxID=2754530 RepID=A0A1Y2FUJ3_PROLT|nr:ribosomal protein S5 domain 2-type protein [Protomyces lactucae-debilis]ORY87691.1 ribosomal protein S5 domain 2-type protein [Protomyces lactucae-debilis]